MAPLHQLNQSSNHLPLRQRIADKIIWENQYLGKEELINEVARLAEERFAKGLYSVREMKQGAVSIIHEIAIARVNQGSQPFASNDWDQLIYDLIGSLILCLRQTRSSYKVERAKE